MMMSIFTKLFGRREPKKPLVIIQDALGEFTLDPNQKFLQFEGSINWCGEICHVYLQPDGDGVFTAERSLAVLHRLMEQAEDWDQRLKAYSAEEKAEEDGLVHIWGSPDQLNEDVPPITKEEYISQMSMGFLHVMAAGICISISASMRCSRIMARALML
ncbi:MAG: DUF2262 domain-containing protein [Oscillospiraceae bacterium]|nr:DUF2262 domain-containing protein [Oscillospiraceae bacterium]